MTNQQILEKAIQKAIDGGYDMPGHGANWRVIEVDNFYGVTELRVEMYMGGGEVTNVFSLRDIIFSHDFAEALWGFEPVQAAVVWPETLAREMVRNAKEKPTYIAEFRYAQAWRVYLQQMVVAEDLIKYLGENI